MNAKIPISFLYISISDTNYFLIDIHLQSEPQVKNPTSIRHAHARSRIPVCIYTETPLWTNAYSKSNLLGLDIYIWGLRALNLSSALTQYPQVLSWTPYNSSQMTNSYYTFYILFLAV